MTTDLIYSQEQYYVGTISEDYFEKLLFKLKTSQTGTITPLAGNLASLVLFRNAL
jgi:hypothetical protein